MVSETRSGYRQSAGGLVGAIAVSLVLIAAIWALSLFQRRAPADPAPTVDYTAQLAQARAEAPFDVLAPDRLRTGWRATSVDWVGAGPQLSWHLGLLTGRGSDAQYVGLDQGNGVPQDFLAATTTADQPGPSVRIGDATWETLTAADSHETALLLEKHEVTTIVSGTASASVLEAYAGSLTAK